MAVKRKLIIIVGLTLLFGACTHKNAPKKTGSIQELIQLVDASADAWNRGDIKGYMQAYEKSDSVQFITKKGIVFGWDSTCARYLRHYPSREKMGQLRFKYDHIEFLGNGYGHITGTWALYRKADTPSGYFSLITRDKGLGHKIYMDHTW